MNELQPPKTTFDTLNTPRIYAYSDERFAGCYKVGYTTKTAAERVQAQYPIATPEQTWKIEFDEIALRDDGTTFTDTVVHKALLAQGIERKNGEWFACTLDDIKAAFLAVKTGKSNLQKRTADFAMRPEQTKAVQRTKAYFDSFKAESSNQNKVPKFLWNAKMRFGKTFASYQLAKQMGWRKILILTFKPAVQDAWQNDLASHIDFTDWQFISRDSDLTIETADKNKPIVCFGSFQDYLGKTKVGGIKAKNEWVHTTNWDCVIFDEYHYGAWRENAKDLFDGENDKHEQEYAESEFLKDFDQELLPITTDHYLYLSGTPFRALSSGEFIEEQIFNWTYSDEQKAKIEWDNTKGENPYISLPKMVMMTYQMPDSIRDIARRGEYNEFDLNEFFKATGDGEDARFDHENEVQKWLEFIQNKLPEMTTDTLKMGAKKPPMPFDDVRLKNGLLHTFWFLPSVASCFAMANLLTQKTNTLFKEYQIIVAAGTKAGIGIGALPPVQQAMTKNPLHTKSITLSCGKLTTGVSVAPWAGIFMLRNTTSPETYFQAAFRVQTPWVLKNSDPTDPHSEVVLKEQCYVFDFAPERALRQISEYSCRLDNSTTNPEQKVDEFIRFLPVLAYDGSTMREIDAGGILDIAMSGTTATLLARRWESALLVNVDNDTLARLIENDNAMNALMNIEGFRRLNEDIETIINKSEAVKKAKKEKGDDQTPKEKKELNEQEKEVNSLRKQIQEKLIKFATRIPVFMYLTDYREHCLEDVITQLEPDLFRRVTGLTQEDFKLLNNLGVFNGNLMNDAVYKFKRYEDSSLEYTGLDKHKEKMGLWNTVIGREKNL